MTRVSQLQAQARSSAQKRDKPDWSDQSDFADQSNCGISSEGKPHTGVHEDRFGEVEISDFPAKLVGEMTEILILSAGKGAPGF